MTAADVAGSIGRVVDPKFGSWWACQMGSVKSVRAVDAKTVKIELNEPFTPLLPSLAASMTAILPMKELQEGTFNPWKELMGTGPFMVTAHQQNDYWTLTRNPHYWRKAIPSLTRSRFASSPTTAPAWRRYKAAPSTSLTSKIRTHLNPAGATNVKTAIQQPAICTRWRSIRCGTNRRSGICSSQAVNLSLNREQICDVALSAPGHGSGVAAAVFKDGCTSTIPATWPKPRSSRQAGGLSFEMVVQSSQAIQRIAQVIQQNLADAGIDAKLDGRRRGRVRGQGLRPRQVSGGALFWSAYADPGMVPPLWSPSVAGFTGDYVVLFLRWGTSSRAERKHPQRTRNDQTVCTKSALWSTRAPKMIPLVTKPVTVAFRSGPAVGKDPAERGLQRHAAEHRGVLPPVAPE